MTNNTPSEKPGRFQRLKATLGLIPMPEDATAAPAAEIDQDAINAMARIQQVETPVSLINRGKFKDAEQALASMAETDFLVMVTSPIAGEHFEVTGLDDHDRGYRSFYEANGVSSEFLDDISTRLALMTCAAVPACDGYPLVTYIATFNAKGDIVVDAPGLNAWLETNGSKLGSTESPAG